MSTKADELRREIDRLYRQLERDFTSRTKQTTQYLARLEEIRKLAARFDQVMKE